MTFSTLHGRPHTETDKHTRSQGEKGRGWGAGWVGVVVVGGAGTNATALLFLRSTFTTTSECLVFFPSSCLALLLFTRDRCHPAHGNPNSSDSQSRHIDGNVISMHVHATHDILGVNASFWVSGCASLLLLLLYHCTSNAENDENNHNPAPRMIIIWWNSPRRDSAPTTTWR